MMRRLYNRLISGALRGGMVIAGGLALAGKLHAQQPVQWNYSFEPSGQAQATYPGDVNVAGTITAAGSVVGGPQPTVNLAASPYNVKCDGVTDNAAGIQAGMNLAGGAKLVLPAGTCNVSTSIVMTGHVNKYLTGAGSDATVLKATFNGPVILDNAPYSSNDSRIGVSDMTLRCNGKDAGATNIGISWTYVNSGLIRNVTAFACNYGIGLWDNWQTVIENYRVDGLGGDQSNVGLFMGPPTNSANPAPNNAVIMSDSEIQNVATYAYQLQFFAGSKFVNDEGSNGLTSWKLCGVAYTNNPTQACQFGNFVNILGDTNTGPTIDLQQGTNAQPVYNVMFEHVWMGNGVTYCFYIAGAIQSQFDDLHCVANDAGEYLLNDSFIKVSANNFAINRNNNGSYAVTIDGGSNNSVFAPNNQSSFALLGYNGIREINSTSGNNVWGGTASCTPGLTFGGGSTGLTFSTTGCTYQVNGKLVTAQYYLQLSAVGSSTGTALLTGLPFLTQTGGASTFGGAAPIMMDNGASLTGAVVSLAVPNSLTANLYVQGAASRTALTNANFTATSLLVGKVEYIKN